MDDAWQFYALSYSASILILYITTLVHNHKQGLHQWYLLILKIFNLAKPKSMEQTGSLHSKDILLLQELFSQDDKNKSTWLLKDDYWAAEEDTERAEQQDT